MPAITPAVLGALFTGYKASFQRGLERARPQWNMIATEVPSSTRSNTYAWLSKFPKFEKWVGDRSLKKMAAKGYEIENEDYESTVAVPRNDIEDDQHGVYGMIFENMGEEALTFPDELVFQLLADGFTTECHDGQYFFDTDHPIFPNSDGTGTAATYSNMIAGGETPWFILDTSKVIKPLILQNRKKAEFVTKTDASGSDHVFMSKEYLYGVDCRLNVGFSFPQLAVAARTALNADNFEAAVTRLRSMETDGGKKLGNKPTLLVVGPSNEAAAQKLVKAMNDASGASNIHYGKCDLLVSPYLA
ncbi:Mu-like prophage major head subunit gpT family protein [uncultured Endozoicomonas sp.]|uniref:Mu-like prophage major head subunit gpT family protein n=1 Tax=uncultured Endozoicomonas sp. TaxID=432652 RepID=UPI002633F6F3|nr:Mu-like prophage major head subunit gpT family protein [uncultured Endozoicomonas sp.]